MPVAPPRFYEIDDLRIDTVRRVVERAGMLLPISPKAFDVLLVLVEKAGEVISKDELLTLVWPDTVVEEANLTQKIFHLRRVLGEKRTDHRYLVTVPGRGYRFVASVKPGAESATSTTTEPASVTGVAEMSAPTLPALAVLPFTPLTQNGPEDLLAVGIADALIGKLLTTQKLIVRPTSAVLTYRNSLKLPGVIGHELQVTQLLTGTIQLLENQIRLMVQLINVSTGATVWAHPVNAQIGHLFAVQDSLAAHLAEVLSLKLTQDEAQQMAKSYTLNLAAYEQYLRGKFFWNKRTHVGLVNGAECFQRALEIDPTYALALIGLANSYLIMGEYLFLPPQVAFPKARQYALTALELDPHLSTAHGILAEISMFADWDLTEAEREYRAALTLNPNDAETRHNYMWLLSVCGRYPEAVAEIKAAHRLDPVSLIINTGLGIPHYFAGQYELALAAYTEALKLDPIFMPTQYYLGQVLTKLGRYEEAFQAFRTVLHHERKPQTLSCFAFALAQSGNRPAAEKLFAELKQGAENGYVSPVNLALVYTGFNEFDRALDCLARGVEEQAAWMPLVSAEPLFESLRMDPRFERFRVQPSSLFQRKER